MRRDGWSCTCASVRSCFSIWQDAKSRRCEIGVWSFPIALKFRRRLGSPDAQTAAKFQSDINITIRNLTGSRLYEILRLVPYRLLKRALDVAHCQVICNESWQDIWVCFRNEIQYSCGMIELCSIGITLFIFPWTKWPPFHIRHFQVHLYEWKVLYFDSNFTEVCS